MNKKIIKIKRTNWSQTTKNNYHNYYIFESGLKYVLIKKESVDSDKKIILDENQYKLKGSSLNRILNHLINELKISNENIEQLRNEENIDKLILEKKLRSNIDNVFKMKCFPIWDYLLESNKNRGEPILPTEFEKSLEGINPPFSVYDKKVGQWKHEFIKDKRKELGDSQAIVSGIWGKAKYSDSFEDRKRNGGYLLTDDDSVILKWLIKDIKKLKEYVIENPISLRHQKYKRFKDMDEYIETINKISGGLSGEERDLFDKLTKVLGFK